MGKSVQEGDMITTVDEITEEGLCLHFGMILSGGGLVRGIRSGEGIGSGVRFEENRSGRPQVVRAILVYGTFRDCVRGNYVLAKIE